MSHRPSVIDVQLGGLVLRLSSAVSMVLISTVEDSSVGQVLIIEHS